MRDKLFDGGITSCVQHLFYNISWVNNENNDVTCSVCSRVRFKSPEKFS